MIKKLSALLTLTSLIFPAFLSHAQSANKNKVVAGDYEKGQKSQKELIFTPPPGWSKDENSINELGLYSVLVPSGKNLKTADKGITVLFEKKDPAQPELTDLKGYFRMLIASAVAHFPDSQGARWQPSGFDPDKIAFMSIEMYGKKKDKPSPYRLLILDAGDGYYSITLTAETRSELQRPVYEDFFNSISLK